MCAPITLSGSGDDIGTSGSWSWTLTGIFVVAGGDETNLLDVIGPAKVPPICDESTMYEAPAVGGVVTATPACTLVEAQVSDANVASAESSLMRSTTLPAWIACVTPICGLRFCCASAPMMMPS